MKPIAVGSGAVDPEPISELRSISARSGVSPRES